MSSYELLELLEFLRPCSALRTALRGGEYSEEELTLRSLHNEVARLRATMHAVHGGQRYDPPELLSRAAMRDEAEEMEATSERREGFFGLADRDPIDMDDDD